MKQKASHLIVIILIIATVLIFITYLLHKTNLVKTPKISPVSKSMLVGIWNEVPGTSKYLGYNDTYYIYSNGSYAIVTSKALCNQQKIFEAGTWELDNNKLTFTKKVEVDKEGGTLIKASNTCASTNELVNYKIVKKFFTEKQSLSLILKQSSLDESKYSPSLYFDNWIYWNTNNKVDNAPTPFSGFNKNSCFEKLNPCF